MKLTELKGIGPKTEALFNKLGINSCEDLMRYYPVHYEAYNPPVSIGELKDGQYAAVEVRIMGAVNLFNSNRGLTIVSTAVKDLTGTLRLSWYNQPYIKGRLVRGEQFVFHGIVRKTPRGLSMEHPKIFTHEQYQEKIKTLTTVYGLTKGLSNNTFVKAMTEAFEKVTGQAEYLPNSILTYHQLMGEREAMYKIHFPISMEDMIQARSRLAFDEFFLFILSLKLMKRHETQTMFDQPFKASWETEQVISRLPYQLTNAQLRTWHEIEQDLTRPGAMHRLIQGDVGSGKTIIAFLSMVMAADNGTQSALMAPTEVLARQHYKNLCQMIEEGLIENIKPVLLVGSQKKKER
ncbi:MAG: DEAD/DEAH box helicase, partial [Lachnospiraceae bacterium]|nr:DEAD/DEAH box helicase [Candidatus Equihabitans merdae]